MVTSYRKSELPEHLHRYFCPVEIGLEGSLADFIAALVGVFREVRRVLHPTGLLFVNMGDSYAGGGRGGHGDGLNGSPPQGNGNGYPRSVVPQGLKPKDLMLVPARLAIALVDDGWWLRAENVWAKPNPMPESVRDRTTRAHEFVYMFAKQPRYFYDADAVREETEPYRMKEPDGWDTGDGGHGTVHRNGRGNGRMQDGIYSGRNLRSVWTITPEPLSVAHFATFPRELPRRCIKAGSSERGCCPACLSPWRRTTERQVSKTWHDHTDDLGVGQRQSDNEFKGSNYYANYKPPVTTGWEQTCECCIICGENGLNPKEVHRDALQRPGEKKAIRGDMAGTETPGAAGLLRGEGETERVQECAGDMRTLRDAVHSREGDAVLRQALCDPVDTRARSSQLVCSGEAIGGTVHHGLDAWSPDGGEGWEGVSASPRDGESLGPDADAGGMRPSSERRSDRQQDRESGDRNEQPTQPTPHPLSPQVIPHEHTPHAPIPCTVLDPFSGAGTTGVVCVELSRDYVGIELSPEYAAMSLARINTEPPPLFQLADVTPAAADADGYVPMPLFATVGVE